MNLRDVGTALALGVRDEGSPAPDARAIFQRGTGDGAGIGLALARETAEAVGARLALSERTPTCFTPLLPLDEGASFGSPRPSAGG